MALGGLGLKSFCLEKSLQQWGWIVGILGLPAARADHVVLCSNQGRRQRQRVGDDGVGDARCRFGWGWTPLGIDGFGLVHDLMGLVVIGSTGFQIWDPGGRSSLWSSTPYLKSQKTSSLELDLGSGYLVLVKRSMFALW